MVFFLLLSDVGLGVRHVQMLLLFLGLTVGFAMRVNISVAVVAMTEDSVNPDFPVSLKK